MATVTNGASTTSRRPERMLTGLRAVEYSGCLVKLEDGRKYVDWSCGLAGPLFGSSPHYLMKALVDAVSWFSAPASIACRDERIAAEMVAQLYPCLGDKAVRWMCNGSDPCSAAAKLARAVTARTKIISYGYHGFGGTFASPPTDFDADDNRRGALPSQMENYIPLEWLGPGPDEDIFKQASAVIVECPPIDQGWDVSRQWLHTLADTAHEHGALFILDEVVTGFRYGPDGATGYYELGDKVDLWCFGKTIGNGFPVAALFGKPEIMDELTRGVHYSATHFGHPMGLAAVVATMRQMLGTGPWEQLKDTGRVLIKKFNDLDLPWRLAGHPTRPVVDPATLTDADEFTAFRRHLLRLGHIFVDHPLYVNTAMTLDHINDLERMAWRWAVCR